jgi:hypothetical protein
MGSFSEESSSGWSYIYRLERGGGGSHQGDDNLEEERIIELWVRYSILTVGTDTLQNVVPELIRKKNQGLKLQKHKLGVTFKTSTFQD